MVCRHTVMYDALTCTQRGLDNASSITLSVCAARVPSVLLLVIVLYVLELTSVAKKDLSHIVLVCVLV
jgi:hypothetical protein